MVDQTDDETEQLNEFNPGGYAKFYEQILDSSLWEESMATRLVFATMLLTCDKDGRVKASLPSLIRRANVPKGDGHEAIKTLEAPDLNSKSQEYGGRRIEKIDGGWLILNYKKYRDYRSPTQRATAKRQQEWRDRQRYVTRDNTQLATATATATKGYVDTGRASLLLLQIRGLVEVHGQARFIRRDRVEAIGADVAKAFDAVRGMERLLEATGKEYSFLTREFAMALQATQP
jgi:hypothetical protein